MPPVPQTRSNHVRLDPGFHYSLFPLGALLVFGCIVQMVHSLSAITVLLLATALLLCVTMLRMRTYSLKVQDRLIRLEERLRLQSLVSAATHHAVPDLTPSQWTALRFASDAEMPSLAERAAREKLTNRQIKDAIQTWRPDYFRV